MLCVQGDSGNRGFLGPPGIEGAQVSPAAACEQGRQGW